LSFKQTPDVPKHEELAMIPLLPRYQSLVIGFSEEKKLMECLSCQGTMQWKTAPFSIDRNGYHINWDAISAWVCKDCGEAIFEAKAVDLIQTALNRLDQEKLLY
jgi:YgiT-type zinc finger domain-containing protein